MLQTNTPENARLLILDEDRIILQSLSQFLRREGYDVRTSDRPEDALRHLEAGQLELLLADINMPGIKPARFLARSAPAVSACGRDRHHRLRLDRRGSRGDQDGGFDYLTKPIVDEEIRVVVEKAARQQSLLFENQRLRQQLDLRFGLENVVGHDHKMLKIFDLVDAVADSRTTVLMTGESGTGKSLLARAIHHRSPRRSKPFVEVSCGALARDAAGKRIVRPREGRVHRRHRRQAGPIPRRRRRHALPRRDQLRLAGDAGEAAARAAGAVRLSRWEATRRAPSMCG